MSLNEAVNFFEPSAEFVKQATISGMDAYKALCAEAEKDYTGYWARLAREHVSWKTAVHAGARRVQRALLQVVCRRHAERFVQLPRPQRRSRSRRQGGDRLRSRRRRGQAVTYKELLSRVSQFANGLRRAASRRATGS
jgi:acetyl-CoA synthetase